MIPAASLRRDQQLHDLRFLETLQATLAGCGDEAAVYGAAVLGLSAVRFQKKLD